MNSTEIIEGQETTTTPTNYSYNDLHSLEENTTYWYWLECVDLTGETGIMGPVSLHIPEDGGNEGTPPTPSDIGLKQNFPNPFNPNTQIKFALEESGYAELTIYNTKGQKIKTIFQGYVHGYEDDGYIETATWNGEDSDGKAVSSGVYLYRLKTEKESYMKKMLLVK